MVKSRLLYQLSYLSLLARRPELDLRRVCSLHSTSYAASGFMDST